jgi:hypothetical protein
LSDLAAAHERSGAGAAILTDLQIR